MNYHESLSILLINIRRISKNLNNLEYLLIHFSCPPSLIAFSEINLKPFKNNQINIPGYNFISTNEYIAKGGVGLYINKEMSFTILNDININCNKCENIWVKIFLNRKKSVNVGIIYRHPRYDFCEFHESIIDCIYKLNQSRNKFIICGDINIDLLRYGKDLKVNRYVNEITSLGCIIPIDKPTRLTETSSTIIDHFYTNELLTSIDSKIILSDVTDHFPILLNINYSTLKTKTIRCNSY